MAHKMSRLVWLLAAMAVLLCPWPAFSQSWSNSYAYRRTITIDHTKVPNTDQSNFPVLISGTYSYLATFANGGKIVSANGYDIIFTSDAAGTTPLAFERESYSSTTGAVSFWVKIPTLSHTSDTVIYMFYGNGGVTTDQSNKTSVWDSNFFGVWHYGTGNFSSDSTSNGNNLTTNTSVTASSGQIGGGSSYNGSNNVTVSTSSSVSAPFTIEEWAKPNNSSTTGLFGSRGPSDAGLDVQFSRSGLHGDIGNGSGWLSTSADASFSNSAGDWHHYVYVVTTSGYTIYADGSQVGSGSLSGTPLLIDSSHTLAIGGIASNWYNFSGVLDESRLSTSVRSADWIATEYNNSSSPSTFYGLSSEANYVAGTPTIASLSPTSGVVGTSIQILGSNFGDPQGTSTVSFNGTAAIPTRWTGIGIVVPVPAAATTGNVVVTVGGNSSSGTSFTVVPGASSSSYRRTITISHSLVPNMDQADFPVNISGTFPYLATVANGGQVVNANGYDITFASDSNGYSPLSFERDSYSATTGAASFWVKVPTLSHTTDTTIYMFYGSAAITSDLSNPASVWSNGYAGVWHLPDGTSLTANDSTGNANNGTVTGATATTGMVDGAATFNGSSNYISVGNGSSLQITGNTLSVEAWIKTSEASAANYERIVVKQFPSNSDPYTSYVLYRQQGTGKFYFGIARGGPGTFTYVGSAGSLSAGNWTHVVGTYDGSSLNFYLNGALDAQSSTTGNIATSSEPVVIGADTAASTEYFNGSIDEVRISNVARSADWIATEYNNVSNPSSFFSVGSGTLIGSGGSSTPVIASLSPSSGPVTTTVVIGGSHFGNSQGTSTVTYNGSAITPLYWSDAGIAVTIPLAASTASFVVTVGGNASNSATYTVTTDPKVNTIFPTSGMVGTFIVISGINFGSSAGTLTLNGTSVTPVSWSGNSISAVVPSGSTSGVWTVTASSHNRFERPIFGYRPSQRMARHGYRCRLGCRNWQLLQQRIHSAERGRVVQLELHNGQFEFSVSNDVGQWIDCRATPYRFTVQFLRNYDSKLAEFKFSPGERLHL